MRFARCMRMGQWACTPAGAGAPAPHVIARRRVAACARPAAREMQMVAPENRQEVAVILDLADQAAKGWSLVWSRFVTPPVAADALAAISQVGRWLRACDKAARV